MHGVYGKPWLDLDSLLPLDILDIEEIEIGLAKAPRKPNIFGRYNKRDFMYHQRPPEGASERVKELYRTASVEDLQFFTKVAYGVYSPGHSVKLSYCGDNYIASRVDDHTLWTPAHHDLFPSVYKFLKESNVFESTGRLNVFIQEHNCAIPIHTDYVHPMSGPGLGHNAPPEKEFLWINPRRLKSLFVLDDITNERYEITSCSAWFNALDLHGGDPVDRMTWTFRLDGVYTPWFREQVRKLHSDGKPL